MRYAFAIIAAAMAWPAFADVPFSGAYVLNQEAATQHARYKINGTGTSARLVTTAGGLTVTFPMLSSVAIDLNSSGVAVDNHGSFLRYVPTDTDQGPVSLGVQEQAIVQSGADDMAYGFCYNDARDPGFHSGEAQFCLTTESNYLTGGQRYLEWYTNFVGNDGVTGAQPIKLTIDRSTAATSMQLKATTINLVSGDDAQVWSWTGANSLNKFYKSLTLAENVNIGMLAGSGALDMHLGTGTYQSVTGQATFNHSLSNFTNMVNLNGGVEITNSLHVSASGAAVGIGTNNTVYAGTGSGDVLLDNGTATSPKLRFLNGANSNGCVYVASGAVGIGKNCGEAGGAERFNINLASGNVTVGSALFADGGLDRSTAAALNIANGGNATSVVVGAPISMNGGVTLGDAVGDSLSITSTTASFTKEAAHTVSIATSTTTNTAGGALTVAAGTASGNATGGNLSLNAGGTSSGSNGAVAVGASNTLEVDVTPRTRFGPGGNTHSAFGANDVFLDDGDSGSPVLLFLNGANSNGAIDVASGALRFIKKYYESGSGAMLALNLSTSNATFGGSIFADNGIDRSTAVALNLANGGNATEIDTSVPLVSTSTITASGAVTALGVKLTSGAEPACDSSIRGKLWYVAGGAGVADTVKACTKDNADAYAWRALY